jgi:hypothetical protein
MKIKLNNCNLKKNTQLRLLEYFLLEVTPRSVTNLPGIHPNTADLFYKKIRQIISFHLALQTSEVLMVVLNLMRDILAVCLPRVRIISMVLKIFKIRPKEC